MPMAEALRRAPHAIVVRPAQGSRTRRRASEVFAIFRRYTPLVEPLSLDEAFLDVTASRALFGDGEAIARAIKRDVRQELAPHGLRGRRAVQVRREDRERSAQAGRPRRRPARAGGVAAFLAPLPIERMWGIGPKTAPRMRVPRLRDDRRSRRAPPRPIWSERSAAGGSRCPGWRGARTRGTSSRTRRPSRSAPRRRTRRTCAGPRRSRRTLLDHSARVARRLVRAGRLRAYGDRQDQVRRLLAAHAADQAPRGRCRTPTRSTAPPWSFSRRSRSRAARVRLTGVSVSGIVEGSPAPHPLPRRAGREAPQGRGGRRADRRSLRRRAGADARHAGRQAPSLISGARPLAQPRRLLLEDPPHDGDRARVRAVHAEVAQALGQERLPPRVGCVATRSAGTRGRTASCRSGG